MEYVALNRANWDERAPVHAASPDYGFERFAADADHLSSTVRFDLPRLGDISGRRGVHLQCHIGTDTVSLARLGARMTGVDFSPASLREARRLVGLAAGAPAVDFVECDVYAAADHLPAGGFDLVYTGIGAICWLPDIDRWARVVATLLRPGGRLFLREGHPMLWAIDEQQDLLVVDLPYHRQEAPLVWDDATTYVETDVRLANTTTHSWNHGLGEIFTALFDAGMAITRFVEHDSVPWEALPGKMQRLPLDEWRLLDRPERLPHSYTLEAVKAH